MMSFQKRSHWGRGKRTLQFDDFVLLWYRYELGAELDTELGVCCFRIFFRVYKWVAWGTYGWIWVDEEALVCESDEEG